MINLYDMTVKEKINIIAKNIITNSKKEWLIKLANDLKTPENDMSYAMRHVKYSTEGQKLYEPEEILRTGEGDCKAFSLFIGSLAYIQGYPVKLHVIANNTEHMYPSIKVNGRWNNYDAVKLLDDVSSEYIRRHYHTILDGFVTDDINHPIRTSSFAISGISKSTDDRLFHSIISGAGFSLGSILSNLIVKAFTIGGFGNTDNNNNMIAVSDKYEPEPNSSMLFYYETKWYIPEIVQKWIIDRLMSTDLSRYYGKIERVYEVNQDGVQYMVAQVHFGYPNEIGQLGFIVAAVAAAIIGGGLFSFLSLSKVYKIMKSPSFNLIPYALLAVAGTILIHEVKTL